MSAMNALKVLLVNHVMIDLAKEYGKSCCSLVEPEAGYCLTIRFVPEDAIVFKCDSFPNTGEVFFNGRSGECKRADYVLVSESEKVIMIFELQKSNRKTAHEITAQLKGAKCIVDYCESISSEFLGMHDIFCGFTYRYYKSINTAPRKRAFGKEEKPANQTPETARIIPGSSIPFDFLM